MAKTGRPRIPDEIKKLKGTYRHDRANPDKPEFSEAKEEDIDLNDEDKIHDKALKIYEDLKTELIDSGVLQKTDLFLFSALVNEIDLYYKMDDKIKDLVFLTQVTVRGSDKVNPLLGYRLKSLDMIMKLASKFGLSPVDRQKIIINRVKEEEAQSKLDAILSKRKNKNG